MIKVGQKIRLTETDVLEVEYITKNKLVVGNTNGNPYTTRLEYVDVAVEDGIWEIIEDVPSVEEQLKGLGFYITRISKNIFFHYEKDMIIYEFKTDKLRGGITTWIGTKELKLILQYIEENENG